jgi:uncharacterized protein YjbJ (UPF0337 family)
MGQTGSEFSTGRRPAGFGSRRTKGTHRNTTQPRRLRMKSSTKNQVKGKLGEVKGKAKEVAGKVIRDPELEAEGKVDKTVGKGQKKLGDIKKAFGH